MSRVTVRATLLIEVDVDEVRNEAHVSPQDATDEEVAVEWVKGCGGATIDNHGLIDDVLDAEVAA